MPRLLFAAIKIGSIAMLLPIYFTVCHRMIPFFAGAALPRLSGAATDVGARRLSGRCALLHTWLELRHGYAWLWLPDLRDRGAHRAGCCGCGGRADRAMPALLRVLFIGFAWLPIAFAAVRDPERVVC